MNSDPTLLDQALKAFHQLAPPLQSSEILDEALHALSGRCPQFPLHPSVTCDERLLKFLYDEAQLITLQEAGHVIAVEKAWDLDPVEVYLRVFPRFSTRATAHDPRYHSFRPLVRSYCAFEVKKLCGEAARKRREEGLHVQLMVDVPTFDPNPTESAETLATLQRILERLGTRDTRILQMFKDGSSAADIARIEGLTPQAARKALSRARRRFADQLAAHGFCLPLKRQRQRACAALAE